MRKRNFLKKALSCLCMMALIATTSGYTIPNISVQNVKGDDGEAEWTDATIAEDQETWSDFGKWKYCFLKSNESQAQLKGGDATDNLKVKVLATQKKYPGMRLKITFPTEVGRDYNFSMNVNATNADSDEVGKISVNEYAYEYDEWEQEGYYYYKGIAGIGNTTGLSKDVQQSLNGTIKATQEETTVVIQIQNLTVGTEIEFSNVKCEKVSLPPNAPTEIPEGYTLVTPNTDPWESFGSNGQWQVYAGANTGEQYAYVAAKEGDTPYDLKLNFLKSTANEYWMVQCKATFDVDIGEKYICELYKGDTRVSRKIFTSTSTTYTTDVVGLGDTPEGTVLDIKAVCRKYDDSEGSELLPNKMTFADVIDSKYCVTYGCDYTQTSTHAENTEGALTDGSTLSGYLCTERELQNQDVIITLKKEQPVSNICCAVVDFQNNITLASNYSISVSDDGENYQTIGNYTTDAGDEMTFKGAVIPTDISKVTIEKYKYVKLHLEGGNAYGYQLTEFGLISKEKREEETTKPRPTQAPTTQGVTTKNPSTTVAPTKEQQTTKADSKNSEQLATTYNDNASVVLAKTSIKKATKKKSAIKAKISLKKVSGVKGYRIQISKTVNFKKAIVTKTVSKVSFTVKSKKMKKAKKLYVRAQVVKEVNGKKVYGAWTKAKKIKIIK